MTTRVRHTFIGVAMTLIAFMWGAFGAWERATGPLPERFQLFAWALLLSVTWNALGVVWHITRPHAYINPPENHS